MAMKIQVMVFWAVMISSDVVGYQHSGGPCCLHLQGDDGRRHQTFPQHSSQFIHEEICDFIFSKTSG
jgi:hypothetical protein